MILGAAASSNNRCYVNVSKCGNEVENNDDTRGQLQLAPEAVSDRWWVTLDGPKMLLQSRHWVATGTFHQLSEAQTTLEKTR